MALKGQPISVGTSDTTVYTCPATLEGSVHGLVFSNVTGSAATITIKMYIQSTGVTTTVATGISVAANATYTWPKPVDVNAGDIIKASASTGSAIVCVYSAYENAATPAATGFTPRGAWSSVASYVTNDTVSYTNGNSYVAIQASLNQQPDTQTAYWQLLAEKGATGSGNVAGPGSSTDNAVARFDGTTGQLIQNSAVTIADTTGDITGGKYNGLTVSTTTGTFTIANGKTLAVDNTLTFVGTDSSTVSFGAGGTVAYTSGTLAQFASTTSSQLAGVISDETGSGSLVFATSPTLVTPRLAGSSTGYTGFASANSSATNYTVTFPAADMTVGYINIPQVTKTGAYTPTDTSDVGKHISITTGGVTVNASIYSAGDVFTIYNNSSSNQTITAGTNVTFRLAGTATTGNRTLAQYGTATLLCVTGGANPVFAVSGAGVT